MINKRSIALAFVRIMLVLLAFQFVDQIIYSKVDQDLIELTDLSEEDDSEEKKELETFFHLTFEEHSPESIEQISPQFASNCSSCPSHYLSIPVPPPERV